MTTVTLPQNPFRSKARSASKQGNFVAANQLPGAAAAVADKKMNKRQQKLLATEQKENIAPSGQQLEGESCSKIKSMKLLTANLKDH